MIEAKPPEVTPAAMGERLKLARVNLQYSEADVAAVIGVKQSDISRIESGERPVSTMEIAKLASLYCKSIKYLVLGETDVANSNHPRTFGRTEA